MFFRKWSKAPRSRSTKTTLRTPRKALQPHRTGSGESVENVGSIDPIAQGIEERLLGPVGDRSRRLGQGGQDPSTPKFTGNDAIDGSESENCHEGHRTTNGRESTNRRSCLSSVEPRILSLRCITTQNQAGRYQNNASGLRCPAIPWQFDDGRSRGGIRVSVQSRISPVTRLNLPESASQFSRGEGARPGL